MFASRLKMLRSEKNLTQKELADILNMQNTAISKYELGERKPDQDTLIKIADFFSVSTDYLLGNSNVRNPYQDKIIKKDELILPDEFATPEEAVKFLLEQNVIMGFGGFDIDKLSDEEKVQFANELLGQLKLLSYKYKK